MKKVLLLLTTLAFISGCGHNLKVSKDNPFHSFTKMTRIVKGTLCTDQAKKQSECIDLIPMEFNASGVIIGENDESSFILTAGHFCQVIKKDPNKIAALLANSNLSPDVLEYFESIEFDAKIYADDYMGTRYYTNLIAFDEEETDACIVRTEKRMDYDPVYVSDEVPEIGDRLYMPSAPMGIHHHGGVIILDGFYSGEFWHGYFDKWSYSITDMPLLPGSSGAAIMNEDFEIVSLAYATNMGFPHDAFGVPLHQIRNFLDAHLVVTTELNITGWFEDLFN